MSRAATCTDRRRQPRARRRARCRSRPPPPLPLYPTTRPTAAAGTAVAGCGQGVGLAVVAAACALSGRRGRRCSAPTVLGEEEQAERTRRRQWAAAAAQSEQDRADVLRQLGPEIERWATDEHVRLQPLQAHVWRALRVVAASVQSLWGPSARVELFGSWASGLQLTSSDVDLLVCGAPAGLTAPAALRALSERLALSNPGWLASVKLVDTARVPVIKAAATLPESVAGLSEGSCESVSGVAGLLQLDISLEGTGHSGRASTRLTRDVFALAGAAAARAAQGDAFGLGVSHGLGRVCARPDTSPLQQQASSRRQPKASVICSCASSSTSPRCRGCPSRRRPRLVPPQPAASRSASS